MPISGQYYVITHVWNLCVGISLLHPTRYFQPLLGVFVTVRSFKLEPDNPQDKALALEYLIKSEAEDLIEMLDLKNPH